MRAAKYGNHKRFNTNLFPQTKCGVWSLSNRLAKSRTWTKTANGCLQKTSLKWDPAAATTCWNSWLLVHCLNKFLNWIEVVVGLCMDLLQRKVRWPWVALCFSRYDWNEEAIPQSLLLFRQITKISCPPQRMKFHCLKATRPSLSSSNLAALLSSKKSLQPQQRTWSSEVEAVHLPSYSVASNSISQHSSPVEKCYFRDIPAEE